MPVPSQKDGEVVKPGDDPLELDAVHQEHGDRGFVLSHMIQEHVLNILRFFSCHDVVSFFLSFNPGGRIRA
jgi:hypothetical protein